VVTYIGAIIITGAPLGGAREGARGVRPPPGGTLLDLLCKSNDWCGLLSRLSTNKPGTCGRRSRRAVAIPVTEGDHAGRFTGTTLTD